jgi:hypothetical protein
MLSIDPGVYVEARRRELMAEAEQERLAMLAAVPHGSGVRRELALACYRLASWLDEPGQYFRQTEAGHEHWVLS